MTRPPPLAGGRRGVTRLSGRPVGRTSRPPSRLDSDSSRGKYLGVRGLSLSSAAPPPPVVAVTTSSSSPPTESPSRSKDFRHDLRVNVVEACVVVPPLTRLLAASGPPSVTSWLVLVLPRRVAMLSEWPLMGRWLAMVMGVTVAWDLVRDRRGASTSLRLMPLSRVALELAVLACTEVRRSGYIK